ncbi:hypothetical protein RvY_05516-2 [Ramazzottius varieornatus]|uniref:Uncharacterized protein n=1 Tax=Ramazzottius varieornatus TaxID=947166 RepID=A0A1D1UV87_RAMVA|nr:hypothetical protein RvY_05516-2 [Ramazzottius varieornatus]
MTNICPHYASTHDVKDTLRCPSLQQRALQQHISVLQGITLRHIHYVIGLLECSLKFLGPLIFSLVLGNRRTKDLAGQGRDSFVRSALQMRFEDVVGTEASNPSQWMLL